MKRRLSLACLLLPLLAAPYAGSYLFLRRRCDFLIHRVDYYASEHSLEARTHDSPWLVGLYAPLELVEVLWWRWRHAGEGQIVAAFACGLGALALWRRPTTSWQGKLLVCGLCSALCALPAGALVKLSLDPSTKGWTPMPAQFMIPQDAAAVLSLVGIAFLALVGVRFWEPTPLAEEVARPLVRFTPKPNADPSQPSIVYPSRRAA